MISLTRRAAAALLALLALAAPAAAQSALAGAPASVRGRARPGAADPGSGALVVAGADAAHGRLR